MSIIYFPGRVPRGREIPAEPELSRPAGFTAGTSICGEARKKDSVYCCPVKVPKPNKIGIKDP